MKEQRDSGWYQDVPFGDGTWSDGEQDCQPRWDAMSRLHGDLTGKRALDLGCAEGFFSAEMADRGADVRSIEHDSATCERFRQVMARRKPKGEVVLVAGGDATDEMAACRESFDIVLSLNLIHHLPSPLFHVHQCARSLSLGGVLYLEAPYEPGPVVRLRKRRGYVLGAAVIEAALRRELGQAKVVHNWRNSVGNHRIMWEAVKC